MYRHPFSRDLTIFILILLRYARISDDRTPDLNPLSFRSPL
jgi:hypothetical protein